MIMRHWDEGCSLSWRASLLPCPREGVCGPCFLSHHFLTVSLCCSVLRPTHATTGREWRNKEGVRVEGHCALWVVPDPRTVAFTPRPLTEGEPSMQAALQGMKYLSRRQRRDMLARERNFVPELTPPRLVGRALHPWWLFSVQHCVVLFHFFSCASMRVCESMYAVCVCDVMQVHVYFVGICADIYDICLCIDICTHFPLFCGQWLIMLDSMSGPSGISWGLGWGQCLATWECWNSVAGAT